jgi:hypothetical protein
LFARVACYLLYLSWTLNLQDLRGRMIISTPSLDCDRIALGLVSGGNSPHSLIIHDVSVLQRGNNQHIVGVRLRLKEVATKPRSWTKRIPPGSTARWQKICNAAAAICVQHESKRTHASCMRLRDGAGGRLQSRLGTKDETKRTGQCRTRGEDGSSGVRGCWSGSSVTMDFDGETSFRLSILRQISKSRVSSAPLSEGQVATPQPRRRMFHPRVSGRGVEISRSRSLVQERRRRPQGLPPSSRQPKKTVA